MLLEVSEWIGRQARVINYQRRLLGPIRLSWPILPVSFIYYEASNFFRFNINFIPVGSTHLSCYYLDMITGARTQTTIT
jgi:hypothetical protein